MEYPDCFGIVEEKVKPERTRKNDKSEFVLRKPLPQKWWYMRTSDLSCTGLSLGWNV